MSEELRDTCVYAHYRKSDGLMFYIGIGTESRPYEHGRNRHWENVVRKHGYTVEVLLSDLTWKEACDVEVEMIAAFRSETAAGMAKLTNLTDGGEGQRGWSSNPANIEWLANVTEANRKNAADPEWKKRQAEAVRAATHTPEWSSKTAEANRKKAADPEWCHKVTEANRKNAADPEWRHKQREGSRKRSENPEWVRKNAESSGGAARKRTGSTEWRQRTQMGTALLHAYDPHSRLIPGVYPWLYLYSDGKVYAKPFKEKAPPVSTDEAS